MKRKKRLNIKLFALGLAVVAVAAPAAQAMPEGLSGVEARTLQNSRNVIVSPDDRGLSLRAEQVVSGPRGYVVSPDDRAVNHSSYVQKVTPPVVSDSGGDFEVGTIALSGIVLILAAGGMTAFAIHQSHRGKLANA